MGFVGLFFPWGVLLMAVAILHFARRRPDNYWIWVILMGGPIGALVYILIEVIPDAGLLRGSLQGFSRRRRSRVLEVAILDNPSVGNYEELADIYLEERKFARARELYDKVISPRTAELDPFYRRGIAEIELGDFAAARSDLGRVVSTDPRYDFHRAIGLLAHAEARSGNAEVAEDLFQKATGISTISETYYNYATFLAAQKRTAEARDWAQKILAKKATMPNYLRRRERPWFRKAKGMLKQVGQA